MSGRGVEPRKFENEELEELAIIIFVNNFRYRLGKHPDPEAQGLGIFAGVHEALLINQIIEFSGISLLTNDGLLI